MQETRRVSTLQKTWLREDGTGAAHHVVGTSWSVGWVTTAETITKKNKSRGLNKLQKAQCPSKETRRGLQLPSKRVLSPNFTSLGEAQGERVFPERFWKSVWPQANQMAFPSLLEKIDPVWLKISTEIQVEANPWETISA